MHMAGSTGSAALPEALVAFLFEAHMFGLSKDYAYPVTPQVQNARWDQITTLAKIFGRKKTFADGNQYDVWDAIMTIAKSIVLANPHINDDEALSVNHKAKP